MSQHVSLRRSLARRSGPVGVACLVVLGVLMVAPVASGGQVSPAQAGAQQALRMFDDAASPARGNGIDALHYAAEMGDAEARWKLGDMYGRGDGVARDDVRAFELLKQVADSYGEARPGTAQWQFTAQAMVRLGRYFLTGVPAAGIDPDLRQARALLTTAAIYFNHPDAQFELARLQLGRTGSEAEAISAARLLKRAVNAGHAGARAMLGHMLFEGRVLARDPGRGLAMMMLARRDAGTADRAWIDALQQGALAAATPDERDAARRLTSAN